MKTQKTFSSKLSSKKVEKNAASKVVGGRKKMTR